MMQAVDFGFAARGPALCKITKHAERPGPVVPTRKSSHRVAALSKEEELRQLQQFTSGLDKTLGAAVEDAVLEISSDEDPANDLEEVSGDQLVALLKGQPMERMTVVLCYTRSCIPCKEVKPILAKWEAALDGTVDFRKMALTLPNKEVALSFNIKTSPSFLIFKGGSRLETMRGKNSVDMLKKIIWANK